MTKNVLKRIKKIPTSSIRWLVANAPAPPGWAGRKCNNCGTPLKGSTAGHKSADEADPVLCCPNPKCGWNESKK